MRRDDFDAFVAVWQELADAALADTVEDFVRERFAAERAGCVRAE